MGGVGDNDKATSQQAAAREEFARPTNKRQQQWMTVWATEQNKQFDRGRSTVKPLLSVERNVLSRILLARFSCGLLSFVVFFSSCPLFSEEGTKGDGSD